MANYDKEMTNVEIASLTCKQLSKIYSRGLPNAYWIVVNLQDQGPGERGGGKNHIPESVMNLIVCSSQLKLLKVVDHDGSQNGTPMIARPVIVGKKVMTWRSTGLEGTDVASNFPYRWDRIQKVSEGIPNRKWPSWEQALGLGLFQRLGEGGTYLVGFSSDH